MADPKEMARRHIDMFNQGRFDEMAPDWAEDIEFASSLSGTVKGREALKAYWTRTRKEFPDIRVQIKNILVDGNMAAIEYTVTGTNSGPLQLPTGQTLPPTGKRVTIQATDVTSFDSSGKIKTIRQYFDAMSIFQQLGLVPATEGAGARA